MNKVKTHSTRRQENKISSLYPMFHHQNQSHIEKRPTYVNHPIPHSTIQQNTSQVQNINDTVATMHSTH